MDIPRIIECEAVRDRSQIKMMVLLSNGEMIDAFGYFPDELSFDSGELIGKTLDGARELFYKRVGQRAG